MSKSTSYWVSCATRAPCTTGQQVAPTGSNVVTVQQNARIAGSRAVTNRHLTGPLRHPAADYSATIRATSSFQTSPRSSNTRCARPG